MNPDDAEKGDQWDHVAIDVPSRAVLSLTIGKRTQENTEELVADFARRTRCVPPSLFTTDDCSTYEDVLLAQYGFTVVPERTGKAGRPRKPHKVWPEGSNYATVCKTYKKGRVAAVDRKNVHGTEQGLAEALANSPSSSTINTAFIERYNGTDRTYNARKVRKTYQFSKALLVHMAVSWWVITCYNFHHIHRSLRQLTGDGTYLHRTPAMALGLTAQPLTVADIVTTQLVGFQPPRTPSIRDTKEFRPLRAQVRVAL